jgi:hypothetical protein
LQDSIPADCCQVQRRHGDTLWQCWLCGKVVKVGKRILARGYADNIIRVGLQGRHLLEELLFFCI